MSHKGMHYGEGWGGGNGDRKREREKISITGREIIFLKNPFMGPVKGIPTPPSEMPGACAKKNVQTSFPKPEGLH